MGLIAVSVYRPHDGKFDELLQVVREHYATLKKEGLATDRLPTLMKSSDGCIIEIMEWTSPEAIGSAHSNAAVRKLWDRFQACSKYNEVLSSLSEASKPFASFEPLSYA